MLKGIVFPKILYISIFFLLLLLNVQAFALIFSHPESHNQLIGKTYSIKSTPNDTLYKTARHYEMGFYEIQRANPNINIHKKIPNNTEIIIPAFFVLPDTEQLKGTIVNLPEMRLYYFSTKSPIIITEPVAIGRPGWSTPVMQTRIVEKITNPEWVVPESIANHYAKKNEYLPNVIRPGMNNPLGHYALRLGKFSILIHGTNDPLSIGKSISSGCIRMYPEDISQLFIEIDKNTTVHIINQPYKIGWLDNRLYLEIHPPLKKDPQGIHNIQKKVYELIKNKIDNNFMEHINWDQVDTAIKEQTGLPSLIAEY